VQESAVKAIAILKLNAYELNMPHSVDDGQRKIRIETNFCTELLDVTLKL
jgi:hypothetical protein